MLKGKIIINTRPEGSEDLIGNALKELGATVLSMPLIEIIPVHISQKVLLDITKNNTYQWLVFTSKNGVDLLFNQLGLHSGTVCLPFQTAVFGKRTALALKEKGFEPDLVNLENTSAELMDDLYPKLQTKEKVLLVLGNLVSRLMGDILESKVNVDRLDVYRTVFVQSIDAEMLRLIVQDKYDLILFTSPSGFNSFMHHTNREVNLSKLKIACLGPTTEEAIFAEGLTPRVVAKPSGKAGLLKEVEHFFANPLLEKIVK